MKSDFDATASLQYDKEFTYTSIGKFQRNNVHSYLREILPENNPINILELNCGTGEDALFFLKNGHKVLATDLSEEMLHITKNKTSFFKENISVEKFIF